MVTVIVTDLNDLQAKKLIETLEISCIKFETCGRMTRDKRQKMLLDLVPVTEINQYSLYRLIRRRNQYSKGYKTFTRDIQDLTECRMIEKQTRNGGCYGSASFIKRVTK